MRVNWVNCILHCLGLSRYQNFKPQNNTIINTPFDITAKRKKKVLRNVGFFLSLKESHIYIFNYVRFCAAVVEF